MFQSAYNQTAVVEHRIQTQSPKGNVNCLRPRTIFASRPLTRPCRSGFRPMSRSTGRQSLRGGAFICIWACRGSIRHVI